MTIVNMIVSDRLVLDVSWFLLLCAVFAFLRFHHWRHDRKSANDRKPSAENSRKTSTTDAPKRAA
jgi:hypothetical protein